jgi:hypothetical protein
VIITIKTSDDKRRNQKYFDEWDKKIVKCKTIKTVKSPWQLYIPLGIILIEAHFLGFADCIGFDLAKNASLCIILGVVNLILSYIAASYFNV